MNGNGENNERPYRNSNCGTIDIILFAKTAKEKKDVLNVKALTALKTRCILGKTA